MIPITPLSDLPAWLQSNAPAMARREAWQHSHAVRDTVAQVIDRVLQEGDQALTNYAHQFNEPHPDWILLPDSYVHEALTHVTPDIREAVQYAADKIHTYCEAFLKTQQDEFTLNHPGFQVGMTTRPVERVACYVPGGSHPLPSTALMTMIPAKVAGVPEVVLCTPDPHPVIIFVAKVLGAKKIYRIGGAQAIAALTFGTQTVEPVDLIVGPGNRYVTEAKRQLQGIVGIDLIAGPSDVTIIADSEADPEWLATDLLAQAEHGPDSRVALITPYADLANQVNRHLVDKHAELELPEFLKDSLQNSAIYLVDDLDAACQVSDALAPEHLMLQVRDPHALKDQLKHYGALFMGYYATVAQGDYAAGPNHTLPTERSARFSAGLTPDLFLRRRSWLSVTRDALALNRVCESLANIEGLTAHAASVFLRRL